MSAPRHHRPHMLGWLAAVAAVIVVAGVVPSFVAAGCGDKGDFPGSWVSARGDRVVIAERSDGDYDVTFVDPGADRREDMTFTLKRDGKKLAVDYEDDGYFIYVTLGGDRITIEKVGSIETFLREK
jgi:hypothetical protein